MTPAALEGHSARSGATRRFTARAEPPSLVETEALERLRSGESPETIAPAWPVVSEPGETARNAPGGPSASTDEGEEVAVTFAVRGPVGGQAMVHLNGVTDRFRRDVRWALLPVVAREGEEQLHAGAYLLPRGLRCSYRVVTLPSLPRDAGATREGWLRIHRAGRPDPLADPARVLATPLGADSSLLSLPGAEEHPAWEASTPVRWDAPVMRRLTERTRLWDFGRSDLALVLFDAEQWAAQGLEAALRRLPARPPLVLAVDSGSFAERADFLPFPDRVGAEVRAALAALEAFGGPAPKTMASGQSYGGLAAVGLLVDGEVDWAFAQSPSLHFVPDHGPPGIDGTWGSLIERVRRDGAAGAGRQLEIVSGTEEAGMLETALASEPVLATAGVDVSVRACIGGHDYAWWRHELMDALERWLA